MAFRRGRQPDYSGELQTEVMSAVWRLGEASVEQVRAELRAGHKHAYTTVQTVMNRLVEHGVLTRERQGRAYSYRARQDEAAFLSRAIGDRLAGASPETRRSVVLNLLGDLQPEDLAEVARYTRRIRRARTGER